MASTKGQGGRAQVPPTVPTQTGGGGDGDDATTVVIPGQVDDTTPGSATRKAFVENEGFEFHPASLVGSWFHRLDNDAIVWQGVVVAEPQPGIYMLQIDTLDVGAVNVQRLVPIQALVTDDDGYDWRFYDSEREAQAAYAMWVATERERA